MEINLNNKQREKLGKDVEVYLEDDSILGGTKKSISGKEKARNYLKEQFFIGSKAIELGNKNELAHALADTVYEKEDAIDKQREHAMCEKFEPKTPISTSMGLHNVDFNNLAIGESVIQWKRLQEDYKIKVTDVDIERKPGRIIVKGDSLLHPRKENHTITVYRDFMHKTGFIREEESTFRHIE